MKTRPKLHGANGWPKAALFSVAVGSALLLSACGGSTGADAPSADTSGAASAAESVAGASSTDPCPTEPDTSNPETVNVLFQTGGDAIGPQQELAKFEEANPGIKVVIDEVPPDALYQKLVTNFAATQADYDLVEFYPTWMGDFASADYLTNLDPYFTQFDSEIQPSDYLEEGSQNNRNKVDGSWYGVPFDNDLMVLYYRKDLFEDPAHQSAFKAKYGVDLAVPETWDDVLQIADYFNGTGDVAGFSTVAGKTWWAVGYWQNLYGAYGGNLQNGDQPNLDRDAFLKANEMYLKLLAAAPVGVTDFGYTESRAAIVEGKTAMSLQWATTAITDPAGLAPGVDIGVALMPGVKDGDSILRTPSLPVGKTLAIPSNSELKCSAFKVAAWMSSPEMQAVETLANSGIDPNRRSVFEQADVKKAWETLIPATVATLPIGVPDMNVPNANAYYDVLINELHSVWSGQASADDAYNRILDGWKSV